LFVKTFFQDFASILSGYMSEALISFEKLWKKALPQFMLFKAKINILSEQDINAHIMNASIIGELTLT